MKNVQIALLALFRTESLRYPRVLKKIWHILSCLFSFLRIGRKYSLVSILANGIELSVHSWKFFQQLL